MSRYVSHLESGAMGASARSLMLEQNQTGSDTMSRDGEEGMIGGEKNRWSLKLVPVAAPNGADFQVIGFYKASASDKHSQP